MRAIGQALSLDEEQIEYLPGLGKACSAETSADIRTICH